MVSIEPNKQSSGFFVPLSVGKAHCSPLIDQMGCEGQAGSGASESEATGQPLLAAKMMSVLIMSRLVV